MQTDSYARLDLHTESTFFVYYQGGPPSAHATPIRLPNGQLVTHKRYFDIRKPGKPFYDSDFLKGKTQLCASGICFIPDSRL